MKKIKGPTHWKADEDVHELVNKVLRTRRPDLVNLNPAILVVFKDIATITAGKVRWACIKKISEKEKVCYDVAEDFLLELSSNIWTALNELQREATIFHELLHIDVKVEDGTFTIRKHDVEEFSDVVEAYGFYKRDLQEFVQSIQKAPTKTDIKRYRLN